MRGRACSIQPYLIISILLSSNKNDTSRASPWPKRHLWHIHLVLAIWDRSGGLTICLIMANYPYTLNLRSLEHPHGLLEAPVKTDLELATICCLMALHTCFFPSFETSCKRKMIQKLSSPIPAVLRRRYNRNLANVPPCRLLKSSFDLLIESATMDKI